MSERKVERRLAAILAADVVSYSRLMVCAIVAVQVPGAALPALRWLEVLTALGTMVLSVFLIVLTSSLDLGSV